MVDGLAAGLAMPAFASSPALLHMSDATYNPGDKLHQRNISQGRRLIRLDSFTLLRLVREPVANLDCATPNSWQLGTDVNADRLVATSAFVCGDPVRHDDTSIRELRFLCPRASAIRAAAAQAGSSTSTDKLPSLDDLSVAAFLQSLDTLEISPAELFQQQQQMQPAYGNGSGNGYALGTPSTLPAPGNQMTASSVHEWATSSAILQPGLSFAVPADFSWWDLGINGPDSGAGSAAVSVPATPSIEPSSMGLSANPVQSRPSAAARSTAHHGHTASNDARSVRPRRPNFQYRPALAERRRRWHGSRSDSACGGCD